MTTNSTKGPPMHLLLNLAIIIGFALFVWYVIPWGLKKL